MDEDRAETFLYHMEETMFMSAHAAVRNFALINKDKNSLKYPN